MLAAEAAFTVAALTLRPAVCAQPAALILLTFAVKSGLGGGYYGGYAPGYYDDSYAYDNGYDNGYAVRNGFTCQPGTWFRGEDGRRYLCQ